MEERTHGIHVVPNGSAYTNFAVIGDKKVTIQVRSGSINDTPCAGILMFDRTSDKDEDNIDNTDKESLFVVSTTEEGFDLLIHTLQEAKKYFLGMKTNKD